MLRKWFWLFNLIAALIVRFLTKRYIGEYDHQTENRYKHEAMVDGEPVLFEILDTCPKVRYINITQNSIRYYYMEHILFPGRGRIPKCS